MSCCTPNPSSSSPAGSSCCGFNFACLGDKAGPLALRLTLMAVMLPHGVQKLQNWDSTYQAFTQHLNIPAPLAVAGMLAEVVFPILIGLGLFTRLAALGMVVQMAVAAKLGGHIANGFMTNWFGTLGPDGKPLGHGYEYHLLYGGAALALALIGPGKIALDSLLCRWSKKNKVACCSKDAAQEAPGA